jgi:hypothetical protein
VNFDLTDDQEALRDGIRSLCRGRFGSERVRRGFDRSVWDELADTGVFSLIADGFAWADAAITFEELGRAVVPGPLVWGVLADGAVDGVPTGLARPDAGTPAMVEHVAASDVVLVLDDEAVRRIDARAIDGQLLDSPLDPLTPITRVAELPSGEVVADIDPGTWRRQGAVLTAAFQVGMAHACVEAATEY